MSEAMANCSLNLKNLPLNVSEETLRRFYAKVGKIRDVRVVTGRAKAPNFFAFAFVDFATPEICSRALNIDPSPLGTSVEAKLATQRSAKAAKSEKPELPSPLEVADARSIVATGASPKLSQALFAQFFARFGEVESVKVTQKPNETRAFVRFTEERFAKAALSQRNRVIDDDVLIFIRPASEKHQSLYWHSSVVNRLHAYFDGDEGDDVLLATLGDLVTTLKAEEEAVKAKQEEEEEYRPGDADAGRRCRRVFVALGSDSEDDLNGSEADDEAPNAEEQEEARNWEEYFTKFQLGSMDETEVEDSEEWPSLDSTEADPPHLHEKTTLIRYGQHIQSLVFPEFAVSTKSSPFIVDSPSTSDLSEDSDLVTGLFPLSRDESSSQSESGPSPRTAAASASSYPAPGVALGRGSGRARGQCASTLPVGLGRGRRC